MKKIISLNTILIITILLLLSGCGNDTSQNQAEKSSSNQGTLADTNTPEETSDITEEISTETADDNSNTSGNETSLEVTEVEDNLTLKQKNSIAMLNYLATTAEEINVSKDNRLLLEEVYTTLINNTNPDKIDKTTQDHLNNLMDVIKTYRMISIKRDRLQYIHNQDKASTIRNAVPNPLAVLSVTNSLDWKRLVTGVAYTVIDSYNHYKSANAELDQQFLISGWELEDEETENIQKSRERAFNYMIDIVREYDLSGDLSLNENDVKKFAEWSSKDITRKIQFLESNENTYKMFGNYWLSLADCYYQTGEYTKCLDCVKKYNGLSTGIFRKDYDYAQILPKAIVSVQEVYTGDNYIQQSKIFADAIMQNTEDDDWSSRYFSAQVYLDLYAQTDEQEYLNKVYDIALNNVNILVNEQINQNTTYLNDVKELELEEIDDKYLSKEEQKELKTKRKQEQKELDKYNKSLKEKRKTELPALYEPLILNCDLLFAVAGELNINESEKNKIEGILQTDSNGVFLSKPINDHYSFTDDTKDYKIKYNKDKITVPADLLIEGSTITVTLENDDSKKTFDNWKITKVTREDNKIDSFDAYFTNKEINSFEWNKDTKITIKIVNGDNYEPILSKYKVKEYKDNFVIPDKITFKEI